MVALRDHTVAQVFHEMDLDGSGEVTFTELLKLMYPYATPSELETMESWVSYRVRATPSELETVES